ncbi:hypothetical protein QUA81_07225 [Microcoleus sp. F6_B4]
MALDDGTAIAAISLWYGQSNHLMPQQASEQAPMVDDFFTRSQSPQPYLWRCTIAG